MTDVQALRKAIENSGMTMKYLAKSIGLTREGFYRKLRGESEFKASEIVRLSYELRLDAVQRDEIFLNVS